MKSAKDDGNKHVHVLFLLIGGDSYKVEIEENHDTFFANINGKQIKIFSEWQLGNAIMNLSVDDVTETIHVSIQIHTICCTCTFMYFALISLRIARDRQWT